MHLLNHLILGSTLATVPGATVDWYCKGLMTFPRLLLTEEERCHGKMLRIIFEQMMHLLHVIKIATIAVFVCTYSDV